MTAPLAFLIVLASLQASRAGQRIIVGESLADILAADPVHEGAPPSKRFKLALDAQGPVRVSLESFDFDAVLRVETADGELLAEDDDSGVETDACLVIAGSSGAYIVIASSKSGLGEFELSVRAGEAPAPAGAALLDASIVWRSRAAERALARHDKRAAAKHRLKEGSLRHARAQLREARAAFESSLALAREVEDRVVEAAALGNLGAAYSALGDYPNAREHHEQLVVLARELGDRAKEAVALGNLGQVYCRLGDYPRARELHEQHLELARELGDRAGEAVAIGNLGDVYYRLGDYPRAREHHEQRLALARELGDRVTEGWALGNLGSVYSSLAEYPRARELYEQWLAIARELGDRRGEAVALGNLGGVDGSLGDYPRAREHYEQHLALSRELGDRAGESTALGGLGVVYLRLGDYPRAREHLEQHLALARALGDRRAEAGALGNLGDVYASLDDYPRARERFEEQLALVRGLGNRAGEATALGNLGSVHHLLGDYSRARERYEQWLALARELGDRRGEAGALGGLGIVDNRLGDYQRARAHHEQHLALARELGDRSGEARALGNLGNVYHSLGDYPRARAHHEQNLVLARELGDRAGEAAALGGLGTICASLGDHALAREYHEQRLALARELGNRAGEARALGNLGEVCQSLGDYPRARAYHEQCLALARELGYRVAEAAALGNLGGVCQSSGDYSRAREHFEQHLALARELGDRAGEAGALVNLAAVHRLLNDSEAALANLLEAEGLIDLLASAGLEPDEASGLRGRFSGLGAAAQDLAALRCAEAGEDPRVRESALAWGFAAAGRWKGRALLEGIAEHRAGARSAEAIELRRERREALAMHQAILERVSKEIHDGKPHAEVEGLRAEADAKLSLAEQLAARLRETSPGDAALDLPLGASPEDVRRAVLGPGEILVEYVEGEERVHGYALGEDLLEFLDLGLRSETAKDLEDFLDGIRDPGHLAGPAEVARSGRALFERLLAPALAAAKEPIERLVIVPSATLAALPFEALVVESSETPASFADLTFVLDRFEVTYGPSSPVLVELAATAPRSAGGKVLVLADPRYRSEGLEASDDAPATVAAAYRFALPEETELVRLPGTREEAVAIAGLVVPRGDADLAELREQRSGVLTAEKVELHLGSKASRGPLSRDLRGYSVLHLACHGFVDAEIPQQSGIALAPSAGDEGWFTIQDALELDLDADLVVLSACETARGEAKAGEGVESLARAFLYAGARGVVASLWKVDDRAAAGTMEAFYRRWLHEGQAPARALREAKLALRRGEVGAGPGRGVGIGAGGQDSRPVIESGHPFFWAPFIHVGLGR